MCKICLKVVNATVKTGAEREEKRRTKKERDFAGFTSSTEVLEFWKEQRLRKKLRLTRAVPLGVARNEALEAGDLVKWER